MRGEDKRKVPFCPSCHHSNFLYELARKRLLHRLKSPYKTVLVLLKYVRLKGNNALPPVNNHTRN